MNYVINVDTNIYFEIKKIIKKIDFEKRSNFIGWTKPYTFKENEVEILFNELKLYLNTFGIDLKYINEGLVYTINTINRNVIIKHK